MHFFLSASLPLRLRLSRSESARRESGASSALDLRGRRPALPALAAEAADLVAVGDGAEAQPRAAAVLQLLDPRLVELDDLAASEADQVIVVLPRVEPLVAEPFVA